MTDEGGAPRYPYTPRIIAGSKTVTLSNKKLSGLLDPTDADDATTRGWVDAAIAAAVGAMDSLYTADATITDSTRTVTLPGSGVLRYKDSGALYEEKVDIAPARLEKTIIIDEGASYTPLGLILTAAGIPTKGVPAGSATLFSADGSNYVASKEDGIDVVVGTSGDSIRFSDGSIAPFFLDWNPADFECRTTTSATIATFSGNIVLSPGAPGTIDVSSARVTNGATPTTGTDLTTKDYVDVRYGRRDVREVGSSSTVTIADNVILVSTITPSTVINIDLFDASTYPTDGTTRSYSVIRATHVPLSTTVRVRLTGGDVANGFGYRGYTEWYLNSPEDAVECFVYNSAVLGPMWSLPTRKTIFRQILFNIGSQALNTGATTSTITLSFTTKQEDQPSIASSAAVPTTSITTNVAGAGTFRLQGFVVGIVTTANHSHVLNLRRNAATISSIPLGAQFDGEILPFSYTLSGITFSAADVFDLQLVSTASSGGTITGGNISNFVFSLFPDV